MAEKTIDTDETERAANRASTIMLMVVFITTSIAFVGTMLVGMLSAIGWCLHTAYTAIRGK